MLRIADARRSRDMSQQDLADRLGTTQQQIARWETGKRDPQTHVILRMADVLDVPVSWLLGVDEPHAPALSPDEERLISLFRSTDARGRSVIMTIAESQRGAAPIPLAANG